MSHAIIDVIASDKSHDGNVTLEEYRKVVKMLNLDEQKTDDAFRRMDPSNEWEDWTKTDFRASNELYN